MHMEGIPMTKDELREWINRHHLTHAKAAEILCMLLDGLRKNIYGTTPISA